MKKKIIIGSITLVVIIILVVFIRFFVNNNLAKFKIDNENKYIIEEVDSNNFVRDGKTIIKYYYEIDLDNKLVEHRYDYKVREEAESIFSKILYNKTRKLIKKYKLSDDDLNELKDFLENNESRSIGKIIFAEYPSYYFSINSKEKDYILGKAQEVEKLKSIMKGIKED